MDPLEGLRLEKVESLAETRSGMPYYDGSTRRFKEWKFKIQNRLRIAKASEDKAQRDRNLAKLVSEAIDALSGDALGLAMRVTEEELAAEDALEVLSDRIEENINTNKEEYLRTLIQQGGKLHGDLCRQPGETILSYVDRRRRWYQRIRDYDKGTTISENILTDNLILCANINEIEKWLVRQSQGDDTTFEVAARHLERLCSEVHKREKRSAGPMSSGHRRESQDSSSRAPFRHKTSYKALGRRGWQARPGSGGRAGGPRTPAPGRGGRSSRAYVAFEQPSDNEPSESEAPAGDSEAEQEPPPPCEWDIYDPEAPGEEDTSSEEDPEEEPDIRCYHASTVVHPDEFTDISNMIAEDVACAFIARGADVENPEHCADMMRCHDCELNAFLAREDARKHGVKVVKAIHNFRPRSELTVEERKAALQRAKNNSTCKRCGQKGHWQGDAVCPKNKHKHGGQQRQVDAPKSSGHNHGLLAKKKPNFSRDRRPPRKAMVAIAGRSRNKISLPYKSGSASESHSQRAESDADSSASSVRLAIEHHGVPLVFESDVFRSSVAPMLSGHTESHSSFAAVFCGRSSTATVMTLPEAEESRFDEIEEPARGRTVKPAEGSGSPRTSSSSCEVVLPRLTRQLPTTIPQLEAAQCLGLTPGVCSVQGGDVATLSAHTPVRRQYSRLPAASRPEYVIDEHGSDSSCQAFYIGTSDSSEACFNFALMHNAHGHADDLPPVDDESERALAALDAQIAAGTLLDDSMSQASDFQEVSSVQMFSPEPCHAVGAAASSPGAPQLGVEEQYEQLAFQHQAAVAAHEQLRQDLLARPASPNLTFKFGVKHFGRTFIEVAEEDPGHYFWAASEKFPSPVLRQWINWV